MHTATPQYFIARNNPIVENYKIPFSKFNDEEEQTMVVYVNSETIEHGDVVTVQELISSLQHYPHLIHSLLFNVDFTFIDIEENRLYIPGRQWTKEARYQQWFNKLLKMPCILFFMQNEDDWLYALLGDQLASKELQLTQSEKGKILSYTLSEYQSSLLENRLFQSCLSLLVFCQGSGFNPCIYIQGFIAFFNASFTYEDVVMQYKKQMAEENSYSTVAA